jgi:hypothetical protein
MLAALDAHINDLTALKLAAAYKRMDRGELTRPSTGLLRCVLGACSGWLWRWLDVVVARRTKPGRG